MSTPKDERQGTFKKIIICCDGTWNTPERAIDDVKHKPTNVLKIMRALLPKDRDGRHQVVYYDTGVGTDRGVYDKWIGGTLGLGLSAHVKKAYRFIANNFDDGDELYCFGFSRGAYTVRALGGMIGAVGLLRPADMHRLPAAYQYYRTDPRNRPTSEQHAVIQSLETRKITIKFMGVWDTVGALGIPFPFLKWVSKRRVGFFNTELGSGIQFAYQAVGIDEKRRPFKADLWTELERTEGIKSQTLDVCQVWFAGVHSNVGGGYPDSGLSDQAFDWMIKRAEDCGLMFDQAFLQTQVKADHRGDLVDSFKWYYQLLRPLGLPPYDRSIGPHTDKLKPERGVNEMIHESVIHRYEADPTSYTPPYYRPTGLTAAINDVPQFKEGKYVKRNHIREPVNWEGQVAFDGINEPCAILDLSTKGGAKIRITREPSREFVGQGVTLDATDEAGNAVMSQGVIAWLKKEEGLLGIQFLA